MVPVGRPLAARILYNTLYYGKLHSKPTFEIARSNFESSAAELCGEYSQPVYSCALAWYAGNIPPLPTLPNTTPTPGANNINPWKATLNWVVGKTETSWQAEFATDKTFPTASTDYIKAQTSEVTVIGGTNTVTLRSS